MYAYVEAEGPMYPLIRLESANTESLRQCEHRLGGLDLVLLPGVAFTRDGKRLGHGKGYYDTFLHEHNDKLGRFPYLIALSLKEQIVEDLPTTEHDVVLDEVLFHDRSLV